jgi:predicted TIM-barrel fold metal-dependent hydrolase
MAIYKHDRRSTRNQILGMVRWRLPDTLITILLMVVLLSAAQTKPVFEASAAPHSRIDIPIIDAHSQVPFGPQGLEKVAQLMDRGRIACIILSSKGPVKAKELLAFASNYPGRIVPAVRTKCREYQENDTKGFEEFLEKQIQICQFGAMAEILLYHARKGLRQERAPEVIVYPDDERVHIALSLAKKNRWPFVVHIEFKRAGRLRDIFMKKFEALLDEHSEHPFVLMHMGQLDHRDVRRLIENHCNIYFITSHSTYIEASPIADLKESEDPRTNMFEGNRLSPAWKKLMIEYPERFILGIDNVWPEHWGEYYLTQINIWQRGLQELTQEAAHAFAHRNAERLWSLPPLKTGYLVTE